jgi:hypothetical protein
MYLVSPEHLKQHSPLSPPTTAHNKQKTRNVRPGRRESKQKEQHPSDRWIKIKRNLEDADIERKALIHKIADFLQKVQLVAPRMLDSRYRLPPPTLEDRFLRQRRALTLRHLRYPFCHARIKACSHHL